MKKSEIMAFCERCGAALKHPVTWHGHVYGCECFEHVTGVKVFPQEVRGKTPESIQALITRRTQVKKEWREEKLNAIRINAMIKERYSWLINFLKSCSNGSTRGFAIDMAEILEESNETLFLDWIFTPRQLDIIADMYANQYGRKGSKMFKNHRDEFFKSIELEEVV